jgi:hypothetical protein
MPTRQQVAGALTRFAAGTRGPAGLQALDDRRSQALLEDAFAVQQHLERGDIAAARETLLNRIENIGQLGGDPSDSDSLLLDIERGTPESIERAKQRVGTVVDFGIQNKDLLDPNSRLRQFASQVSTPQTDPDTGQQFVVVSDRNKGTSFRRDIVGATQETPTQKTARGVRQVAGESKARARATRISAIKGDFGQRNRDAARSQVPLREALTLARTASQGLGGSAKIKLARLFPGIDVSDEAALDSNLQRLSLDQLQNFKGPTTDFEFGVTQDVVGKVGDSQSANIARLNSLDRNMWFARREAQQFNNWAGQGKDPDAFTFNFNESIKTKKGTFTLTDLQDTAVENNMTIEQVLRELNR